jgi:hypothetical protein
MTSQVSFTTDPNLKKRALEKAKREGISLKTVLLYSMKAYVDDEIQFGMVKTSKEQRDEKISKWEKTLPLLHLTSNQEKSIKKGLLEAKQRKGI